MNKEITSLALTIKGQFEILGYDVEINDLGDDCNVKVIDASWKPALKVDISITTLEGGITFVTVLCGYEPATEFRGPFDPCDIQDINKTIFEYLV